MPSLRRRPDPRPDPQPRSDSGLLKSAAVVSVAMAASRVTGLARESVLGWLFGASATFDAYVLGIRIPMLSRELFAEGSLSSAFVPTFTRYLATRTKEEARELSNIMCTLVVVTVGLVCVAGIALAPAFVHLFAPGFRAIPGKGELAVSLVRITFPFLLFVALAAQAQGVLNACHRFGIPAVSSSIFNIGSVLFGLLLGYWLGPRWGISAVRGMAAGVVCGGALQVAFLMPSMARAGFAWRPRWNLRHEGVRQILRLMIPSLLTSLFLQANTLVNTNFASGLRDPSGHVMNGPVSWLSYAFRFYQLPMGLFGVAIASATLPRLSRDAAVEGWDEFRSGLRKSLVMIFLLTVPSAAGLAVLGESMIAIVYQHGKFTAFDTHQTALALTCYAAGLAGAAAMKLMSPAFYALGDARTPMLVSLGAVGVNFATVWTLVRVAGFGHTAIALSSAVVATFSACALLWLIRSRIGGIGGRVLAGSLLRIATAAAAAAACCWAVRAGSHAAIGSLKLARMADVSLGIPAGVVAFYLVANMLGVEELTDARRLVLRKLRPTSR